MIIDYKVRLTLNTFNLVMTTKCNWSNFLSEKLVSILMIFF